MDTEVELRHHAYAHKFHTVEGIQRTINAANWCQSVGLNPPEIRTHSDLQDLIEYANLVNVTNVDINIEYNNDIGRMIYMSDKTPITNVLAYVQIPNPQSIALYSTIRIHDPLAVQKWQEARRGYLYIEGKKAVVRSYGKKGHDIKDKIICKKNTPTVYKKDNAFLLDIASHLCDRDYANIKGMTEVVEKEAALFESGSEKSTEPLEEMEIKDNCPDVHSYDTSKVMYIRNEIKRLAKSIQTWFNYPIEIIRKFKIGRAHV